MSYYIKCYVSIIAFLFILYVEAAYPASPSSSPEEWLTPHNDARKLVGEPPLTWDVKLANFALTYGNKRRKDCALDHSSGPYGENLFWSSSQSSNARQAVAGWVSEKRGYNAKSNSCQIGDCGHYTQIVWKKTTKVGCARVVCDGGRGGVIYVCEYNPPGNFVGEKPY